MLRATTALVHREFRTDARSIGPHLVRIVFAVLLYLWCVTAAARSTWLPVSAPGLRFFQQMSLLNYWLMSFAGVSFLATAVTEEKEQQTLGLLKLAGVGSLALLGGKVLPRLVIAALLLTVQFPFTTLAVTLGGVMPVQIAAMYVALLAYAVLLAGTGALASVLAPGARSAAILAMILGGAFSLAGYVIEMAEDSVPYRWAARAIPVLDKLGETLRPLSIASRIDSIPRTSFNDPVVSPQVIADCAIGVATFVLAWLLLPHLSERRLSLRWNGLGRMLASFRPRTASRMWKNAIAWKDFHFVAGGAAAALGWAIIPPLFAIVAESFGLTGFLDAIYYGTAFTVGAALALYAVQIFTIEVQEQTLTTLLVLPKSTARIAYAKLLGCLATLLPVCLWWLIAAMADPWRFGRNLSNFTYNEEWIPLTVAVFGLHAGAYFSIRHRWNAMPIALLASVGGFLLVVFAFNLLGIRNEMAYLLFSAMYGVAILTLHLLIPRQLRNAAAKS